MDDQRFTDASRSAAAMVRLCRQGDAEGLTALMNTLDPYECALVCGSLAAMANVSLQAMDQMAAQLDLPGNSDQVLAMFASGGFA